MQESSLNSFYYSSEEVKNLLKERNCTIYELLSEIVNNIKPFARIPISDFSVGAAAYCESGSIYCGVNIEMKHISMGQVVHAEQCAITNALIHSLEAHETRINILAVSEIPCGHCRQFMQELPLCQDIEIFLTSKDFHCPLSTLLPHSFELPIDGRLWKVFEEPTAVETISKDQRAVWISFCEQHRIPNASEILDYSLKVYNSSFAPYTKSKGSVCLIEEDTTHYYAGMTVESAAYNPTMTPTQSSVVALVTNKASMDKISYMLVLERRDAPCDIKDSTVTLSHALHFQSSEVDEHPIVLCHLFV